MYHASSAIETRTTGEISPLLPHHSAGQLRNFIDAIITDCLPTEEAFVLQDSDDTRASFGDAELREKLERNLLRKLDTKLSILILIYVLNCELCPYVNASNFHSI